MYTKRKTDPEEVEFVFDLGPETTADHRSVCERYEDQSRLPLPGRCDSFVGHYDPQWRQYLKNVINKQNVIREMYFTEWQFAQDMAVVVRIYMCSSASANLTEKQMEVLFSNVTHIMDISLGIFHTLTGLIPQRFLEGSGKITSEDVIANDELKIGHAMCLSFNGEFYNQYEHYISHNKEQMDMYYALTNAKNKNKQKQKLMASSASKHASKSSEESSTDNIRVQVLNTAILRSNGSYSAGNSAGNSTNMSASTSENCSENYSMHTAENQCVNTSTATSTTANTNTSAKSGKTSTKTNTTGSLPGSLSDSLDSFDSPRSTPRVSTSKTPRILVSDPSEVPNGTHRYDLSNRTASRKGSLTKRLSQSISRRCPSIHRADPIDYEKVDLWLQQSALRSKKFTTARSLDSLLLKPVQRIGKYPLFLKTLIGFTEPEHADLPNLKTALVRCTQFLDFINSQIMNSHSKNP